MKTKSLLFSNFKYNPTNNYNFDDLVVDKILNNNTNNGYIETDFSQKNTLELLINNKQKLENITTLNKDILVRTNQIIPYQFINELDNEFFSRLFILTNNCELLELNTNDTFELIHTFESKPQIIYSEDILYFQDTEGKCLIIDNINSPQIEELPILKSFESTNSSLYFTTSNYPYHIFISERCALKNISSNIEQYESIKINIEDGAILNISKLKDTLYIFTQYTIFKYDEDNSNLIKLCELKMEIFEDAISRIDDEFVFLSSNGLYKFDGNDTEKIIDNYLKIDKNAKLISFNQNLYILTSNFNNILFKYNFRENYFYPLFFENLNDFYIIKNKNHYQLCVNQTKNNKYENITILNNESNFNTPQQLVEFKQTNFKILSPKIIKNLHVNAIGNFTLTITSESTEAKFEIKNSQSFYNLGLSGTYLQFKISSKSYFKLKTISTTIEEVDS